MPDANHRTSRSSQRREWRSGRIAVLSAAAIVVALTLYFLLDSNGTRAGESPGPLAAAAPPAVAGTAADTAGGTCSNGRSLYVAPKGRPDNNGSIDAPLDLATALSDASPAKPCDTVWLRGGTYRGAFTSALKGLEGRPVIVRQYPGEHAKLESAETPDPTLQVDGSWTWYWGFEVTNSDPQRSSQEPGPWPSDLRRGTGVVSRGPNIKFINLVVHDTARGFEVSAESIGTEIYGNVVYYNGWETPGGGAQGNGIETQNDAGVRRIADNIIFGQFSHGIIASGKVLNNITLDGNTIFSNGSISRKGVMESRNVLLGTGVVTNKPVVTNNAIYDGQANLGYDAGCANGIITGNYFGGPLVWVKCAGVMKDNIVYDPYVGPSGYGPLPAQYPSNTYHKAKPTGLVVRMRPNQYEPGRATLTVYNWDRKSGVQVNLAEAGLASGDRYEIRDVQNYFGKPILSGTYKGGSVDLPLTGTTVAAPVGSVPVAPKHTLPEFGAFVIVKLEGRSGT